MCVVRLVIVVIMGYEGYVCYRVLIVGCNFGYEWNILKVENSVENLFWRI